MRFKKSIAVLLSAFMVFSNVSIPASAEMTTSVSNEGIAPAYEYAGLAESILYISSNSAECTSNCIGSSDVVQITVEHTLQKYWSLWVWNDVDGASWTKTRNGSSISVVNTKSGLPECKCIYTEWSVISDDRPVAAMGI